MAVRATESRLPSWVMAPDAGGAPIQRPAVSPSELGQAVSTADGRYHLVSFVSSPLTVGSRNDYVIFATGASADRYYWKVRNADGDVVEEDDDDAGVFDWTPDEVGDFAIEVEVEVGAARTVLPALRQTVFDVPNGDLEPGFVEELVALAGEAPGAGAANAASLGRTAVVGDVDSTLELICDLWGYVVDAANATNAATNDAEGALPVNRGIPPSLLAAVVYSGILSQPKSWSISHFWVLGPGLRTTELEWAAEEINSPGSLQFSRELDNALGIAKIRMETAAMLLGGIPWTEKAQDPAAREGDEQTIQQNFVTAFGDPTQAPGSADQRKYERRIDLFNLLRFPKTNVLICARLLARLKNRGSRFRAQTQTQFKDNVAGLELVATEYEIGAVATPTAQAEPNAYGRRIAQLSRLPFIAPHFLARAANGSLSAPDHEGTIYQNADLAEGGGHPATDITTLQNDLRDLGFQLAVEPAAAGNGVFSLQTTWAVREFQIYAKMDNVAYQLPAPPAGADLTQRLRTTPNLFRYGGPVSGVVNRETRRRIQIWKARRWRCPVVVQARTQDAAGQFTVVAAANANIWRHNHVQTSVPRMFVRDFSRYYRLPPGRDETDLDTRVIGDWDDYTDANGNAFNGPKSVRQHTWDESEILPSSLVEAGATLASLDDDERSTFKTIRAVSEVECLGFYDSLNCYDGAFVSLGPCHWTLGVMRGNPLVLRTGELCGYLAYLRHVEPEAFQRAVQFFGLGVQDSWVDTNGQPTGESLLKDERKYASWVTYHDDTHSWVDVPRDEDEGNYYKSWHWFYRWVMACRTIEAFRFRMWDMARIRVRDILSTPWGTAAPNGLPDMPNGSGGTRQVLIGDVFTSERAVAFLLQWHVIDPGQVIQPVGGIQRADANVRARLADAQAAAPGLNWASPPDQWTDAMETALLNAITDHAAASGGELNRRITLVDDWPFTANRANLAYALASAAGPAVVDQEGDPFVGRLHGTRGSFHFDSDDLPPAPNYASALAWT